MLRSDLLYAVAESLSFCSEVMNMVRAEYGTWKHWGEKKKIKLMFMTPKKKKYTSTFFETKFWTKFEEAATIWAEQIIYQLL